MGNARDKAESVRRIVQSIYHPSNLTGATAVFPSTPLTKTGAIQSSVNYTPKKIGNKLRITWQAPVQNPSSTTYVGIFMGATLLRSTHQYLTGNISMVVEVTVADLTPVEISVWLNSSGNTSIVETTRDGSVLTIDEFDD